jgi:23S rRNA (pseudouridine1915-N3)-methyltransferase
MAITILCPSALTKETAIQSLCDDYIKRIQGDVHIIECITKTKSNDTGDLVKTKQAESILKHIDKLPQNTALIALDERGKKISSPALSIQLEKMETQGFSSFCYIIGGAYGLDQSVLDKVHFKLSFGDMVWPHRLVAVMLLEQIYRAHQIRSGHPYHKD